MENEVESMEEFRKEFAAFRREWSKRDREKSGIEAGIRSVKADLQKELRQSLDSDTVKHREHIVTLYAKFERLIYVLVLLVAGVATYLGFQIHDIPNKISDEISASKKEIASELTSVQQEIAKRLETQYEEEQKELRESYTRKSEALLKTHEEANSKILEHTRETRKTSRAAQQVLDDMENAKHRVDDLERQVADIAEDAQALKEGSHQNFSRAVERNERMLFAIRTQLALARFEESAPKSNDELSELTELIALAMQYGKTEVLEELVSVVFLLPGEVVSVARGSLHDSIDTLWHESPRRLDHVVLVRAGLILEHPGIANWVESTLSGGLNGDGVRGDIEGILDAFAWPGGTGQEGLREWERASQRLDPSPYFDYLVALTGETSAPLVAKRSMQLLDFEGLSPNHRKTLNTAMLEWTVSEELEEELFSTVLARLPIDKHSSDFFKMMFQNGYGDEQGKLVEACRELVGRLLRREAPERASFVSYFGLQELEDCSTDEQRTGLRFDQGAVAQEVYEFELMAFFGGLLDLQDISTVEQRQFVFDDGVVVLEEMKFDRESGGSTVVSASASLDGDSLLLDDERIEFELREALTHKEVRTKGGRVVIMRLNLNFAGETMEIGFAVQ